MQMLPDIHISRSTQVFSIISWGKINQLLTYKSVVVKYPTSLLKHCNYSGENMNTDFFFFCVQTAAQTVT